MVDEQLVAHDDDDHKRLQVEVQRARAQQLSAASAPSSEESTSDDAQLTAADPQKWRWFFWRREAVLSSDPKTLARNGQV